jgi:hypothetical protein
MNAGIPVNSGGQPPDRQNVELRLDLAAAADVVTMVAAVAGIAATRAAAGVLGLHDRSSPSPG